MTFFAQRVAILRVIGRQSIVYSYIYIEVNKKNKKINK